MANMSYCRFENTLNALEDCETVLQDFPPNLSDLSESEEKSCRRLINLCTRIAEDYKYLVEEKETENET